MDESSQDQRSGVIETIFTVLSALLLLSIIGILLVQIFRKNEPPAFEIEPSVPRPRGEFVAVSVMVHNTGDDTAKAVQVRAEAPAPDGKPVEAEATMDWLPGKSRRFVTLLFPADAQLAGLDVKIVGYEEP